MHWKAFFHTYFRELAEVFACTKLILNMLIRQILDWYCNNVLKVFSVFYKVGLCVVLMSSPCLTCSRQQAARAQSKLKANQKGGGTNVLPSKTTWAKKCCSGLSESYGLDFNIESLLHHIQIYFINPKRNILQQCSIEAINSNNTYGKSRNTHKIRKSPQPHNTIMHWSSPINCQMQE